MNNVFSFQPVLPVTTTYAITAFAAKENRNGNKFSDLTFYIPGFYRNTQHTNYATVRIVKAVIPLSSYVVDEPYDKLEINGEINTLIHGDYNAEQFGQMVASYIENGQYTESNYVYTLTSTSPFIIGANTTCTTQLGTDVGIKIYSQESVAPDGSSLYYATMPNQYSFDIPDSFYIFIEELNSSLNIKTNQKYFWQILNSTPERGQLNYENNTNSIVIIPPNNSIDYLKIQIKDVNGNFIDFHGVEWTLIIEVAEYLNYPESTPSTGLVSSDLNLFQFKKRKFS